MSELLQLFAPFSDQGFLRLYMSGAMMTCCLAIGLFFIRFWRQTHDRLFLIFGIAFFILGAERMILASQSVENETSSTVFLVRLAAFILIIFAIIDKNRSARIHHD